jgi:hypothetical protein
VELTTEEVLKASSLHRPISLRLSHFLALARLAASAKEHLSHIEDVDNVKADYIDALMSTDPVSKFA